MNKVMRVLLLPIGLLVKIYELALSGARDLHNKIRFSSAIIDNGCCINDKSSIGENCHILENCLFLNSSIKRFSYIGRNSIVQNAEIGAFCSIANDVYIGLGRHPSNLFSMSPLFYRTSNTFKVKLIDVDYDFAEYKKISIGHDVWIGARATILDGVTIGNGAIVAANAVVTKNVPSYGVVAGVPAKVISYRFPENKIDALEKKEWWNMSLNEIKCSMNELNNL